MKQRPLKRTPLLVKLLLVLVGAELVLLVAAIVSLIASSLFTR